MKKIAPYQETIQPVLSQRFKETILKDEVLSFTVGNKPRITANVIKQWIKSDKKTESDEFEKF